MLDFTLATTSKGLKTITWNFKD